MRLGNSHNKTGIEISKLDSTGDGTLDSHIVLAEKWLNLILLVLEPRTTSRLDWQRND